MVGFYRGLGEKGPENDVWEKVVVAVVVFPGCACITCHMVET